MQGATNKHLCEMENRKNIIATNYNLNLLNELVAYIHKNIKIIQSVPAVYIYFKILMTLRENDTPNHFKELKEALHKSSMKFRNEEARLMYDYAQNYCIKKINSGNTKYHEELFSIYESLLENEIIFDNKYLSQWDYKNIVSVALRLEKYEWTKNFIEKYKVRIAPEFRENAYEYNLASYYYSKQEYKSALKLLQKVEFTDIFYHLGAKSMLLKMFYELEDVEPFYSLVDAFKVYLVRNKKLSVYQRVVHQNLVKYTRQAFDLKLKGTNPSQAVYNKVIDKLDERISTEKNITNLQWLKERVGELKTA